MKLHYDVLVIGGGHAGCEAARAAALMGARTCLVTIDMNKIAQMSCNPAVGGIAKGQIVREVDALGGGMGIVTDTTAIQFRMLNKSKGPAMWSPRAQCDRGRFIWQWRTMLDATPGLDIWQDQAEEIISEELRVGSEELRVKSEESGAEREEGRVKSEESLTDNPSYKGNSNSSLLTLHSSLSSLHSSLPRRRVIGVRTIWGCELYAPTVIITAGTFLNGLMHIGRKMVPGGRCAEPAALHLTESINSIGIRSARMKTGTPVRIDSRSVHFEDTEVQPGENVTSLFSFMPSPLPASPMGEETGAAGISGKTGTAGISGKPGTAGTAGTAGKILLPCYTFNTTPECHEILRSGLADSPLYNGQIQSIGPRYCPSIETKLHTFPDRDHHPLFLEPEGLNTNEMYLNGFSSSLPMDIQLRALRAIPALRDVKIYRPGYAIEYDFFDPTQLHHSLMSKLCDGLFFAGQVNGTTGYEEAAGQGIVAGINAALYASHLGAGSAHQTPDTHIPSLTLQRDEAYIGVLIDDLVTKGVDEPYRMFTSRAEYRILLRQDNADTRLTEKSYKTGLASTERYKRYKRKQEKIDEIVRFCNDYNIKPRQVNDALKSAGSTPLSVGCKLRELIARPDVGLWTLAEALPPLKHRLLAAEDTDLDTCNAKSNDTRSGAESAAMVAMKNSKAVEAAEIELKYAGYIEREKATAEKMHRLENIHIRGHFDYNSIQSLSTEARQKLTAIDPATLAQASRIPGVSPSDVNVLLVLMGR
ncbi:MAG: tRNA uridine-5-carboxymethylaminomethyl(34) synthesis enzyme MnmG [Prevotella sp.]|nr:tRNA uridine-5-carboxymethylaminomethyl(34) synthesis enzyme MnmG [Prevotella sp.]